MQDEFGLPLRGRPFYHFESLIRTSLRTSSFSLYMRFDTIYVFSSLCMKIVFRVLSRELHMPSTVAVKSSVPLGSSEVL